MRSFSMDPRNSGVDRQGLAAPFSGGMRLRVERSRGGANGIEKCLCSRPDLTSRPDAMPEMIRKAVETLPAHATYLKEVARIA